MTDVLKLLPYCSGSRVLWFMLLAHPLKLLNFKSLCTSLALLPPDVLSIVPLYSMAPYLASLPILHLRPLDLYLSQLSFAPLVHNLVPQLCPPPLVEHLNDYPQSAC